MPNPYPGKPRFHAFWESRFDYIPDQCHGGSTTIGLQHMVVQSHGDKIYLFPAWPEEWDLNFKVHAARNTVLEGVYQNGVLQSLTVTPSSRAADVIDMSTAANRIRGIVGTCVADTNYLLGLPRNARRANGHSRRHRFACHRHLVHPVRPYARRRTRRALHRRRLGRQHGQGEFHLPPRAHLAR